jgi:serine protease AprX
MLTAGGHIRSEESVRKLAVFFMFGALVCSAAPKKLKVAKDLVNADPSSVVDVIIQWKHAPGQSEDDKVTTRGGHLTEKFGHSRSGKYQLPAYAINDLAQDPDVLYVSPDRPVRAKLDYTSAAVNATAAWSRNLYGSGVTVAIIDSGMNASPDLGLPGSIVYNEDFTGEYKQSKNVQDTKNAPDLFGHGQHVAGIIGSNGKSSLCPTCTRLMLGIAPGVSFVNLRALDENGNGTDSSVIAAIERAIQLKDTYHIRVINLSVGRPIYESYSQDPLCQAVEQAWQAGLVVVVAAGNDGRDNSMGTNGYGTIDAPGNDPYVITVGAMKTMSTTDRSDDLIASYSSKGPSPIDSVVKPDIVAPGNQIASLLASANDTLAKQNPENQVPLSYYQSVPTGHSSKIQYSNAYFMLSGTSMATPVVTGAVADLLQANPALTPDQIKAKLMLTAYKTFPVSSTATDTVTGQSYVSYYDAFTVGAGYLDLAAALQSTAVATGTALSPAAIFDGTSQTISFQADPSSAWYIDAHTGGTFNPTNVWGGTNLSGASVASSGLSGSSVDATRCKWNLSTVDASRSMWNLSTVDASRSMWNLSTVDANRSMWNLSTVDASRSMWNLNTTSAESITTAGEN